MPLTIAQVDRVMLDLGFQQTEAAGFFRWYEFPGWRIRREQSIPAYARVMFYEPRSELQTWVVTQRNASSYRGDSGEYVETIEDVEQAVRKVGVLRQSVSIEELVHWDDERLAVVPRALVEGVRSSRKAERRDAEVSIADLLLQNGVPF